MIKAYSSQLIGLTAHIVTIEVDISNGLHSFSIVGLGDRAVEEAKDRVSAAIKNSGYISPKHKNEKVVISLAPAHIKKEGSSFDLAMALAYLAASGDIEIDTERTMFLGELSLDGTVHKVRGALPIAYQASNHGFTTVYVPKDNAAEASLAQGVRVYGVSSLNEIIAHVMKVSILKPSTPEPATTTTQRSYHDISHVRGNELAKRGLEIAAAGGHNLVMHGPPGTGKTMLARCFHSILPILPYEQSIEVTSIYSAAYITSSGLIDKPPFRSPHHTASYPSIVGGGNIPKPGEITLAHRGVLFMDELPEFGRDVIEALRQPLEDGYITISRAQGSTVFPARCMLIGTMNPCPCGRGTNAGCTCNERARMAYRQKISRPIADRIDLWIPVTKVDYDRMAQQRVKSEESASVRTRVERARVRQHKRFTELGITATTNSDMVAQDIDKAVEMSDSARTTLRTTAETLGLSGRAFHRVIKVAQTIADLAESDLIEKEFILEALQFRDARPV